MNTSKIEIEIEGVGVVEGELTDGENPKTYSLLVNAMPFKTKAKTWGEEVYFETPVSFWGENGKFKVEVGDIAFWPLGKALCLFYGKTPMSNDDKPVAASPVYVVGRITKNIELLKGVSWGTPAEVRLVQ